VLSSAACASAPPPAAPGARPSVPPEARATREVRTLRADLAAVFDTPLADRGTWSVDIRSLDRHETLFARNAGKLMMPASNLKILTLATAALTLGWDHRYTTTLETTAPVVDGILQGDLFVRGTGDPSINSRDGRAAGVFKEWLAALEAAGIRRIDGRIIGDDQAFDDEGLGAGWSWDDLQYDYSAPVGALQYNEDAADLTITPAAIPGAPAVVQLAPGSGLSHVNRVVTGDAGSRPSVAWRRRADGPILEVSGSVPAGGAAVVRQVPVVNPTLFFVESLKTALEGRGILVAGEAVDYDDVAGDPLVRPAAERRVLAASTSPPLSAIATVLMKVSQNLYAETLLKTAGAAVGGLGTTAAGLEQERRILHELGVPDDAYVIVDGSGLSRYNYVTAATISTVLERFYADPRHREPFMATLPVAGRDGTMASRLQRTRAADNALAKTGSLSNVRALAGYVRTRDGELLSYVILANAFGIPSSVAARMADLAVEVLANFSRGD
jgi:D-alanyl-D-alanine carboxypeptidase/D-alanyl-D-alanine-endopeptidase (penicillin-binding protein 4)